MIRGDMVKHVMDATKQRGDVYNVQPDGSIIVQWGSGELVTYSQYEQHNLEKLGWNMYVR